MTSVAFASMEVSGGPMVGFQGHGAGAVGAAAASSTPAYGVRELFDRVNAARRREEEEEEEENRAESSGSSSIGIAGESSLSLSSSSSAAAADDGGGDGEEEVQSELKEGALGSLASLEECLPIKRGLSNCFAGKSKSFASLADAASLGSAGTLAKPENPFNKRRRILMACKASWQRRASYAALNTSALRVLEEDEDEDDEEAGRGVREESLAVAPPPLPPMDRRLASTTFRSPRSFSLTDLQHA